MSLKNLNAIKIPKNLSLKLSNQKIQKLYSTFEKNFQTCRLSDDQEQGF